MNNKNDDKVFSYTFSAQKSEKKMEKTRESNGLSENTIEFLKGLIEKYSE